MMGSVVIVAGATARTNRFRHGPVAPTPSAPGRRHVDEAVGGE
jgi:hypothetical protein